MDKDINYDAYQDSYFAYLNEISRYDVLSSDEEITLIQKIQAGDNVSKALFINCNLRLVVKRAKLYYIPGYNDIRDLIQEGNIGLMAAIDKFDPSRGCRFSTYAVPKIDRAMQNLPSRYGHPLEIPRNKLSLIHKIRYTIEDFERLHDRKPSTSEISNILNIHVEKINSLMPFVFQFLSLSAKVINDGAQREYIDFFEEYYKEETSDVELEIIHKESKDELYSAINTVLNDKEKYILYSRWGLAETPIKSVDELATELGMSIQGVRQSEQRSIAKLNKYLLSINRSFSDFF